MNPLLMPVVLLALTALRCRADDPSLELARTLAAASTITRDSFGIPHAHGTTDAAAVFAAMYARAEDEMARIENSHATAIGRASLLLGEAGVSWDKFVLSYEVPELAKVEYEKAPADVKALTDAAAAALNYYISLHPTPAPKAIEHWEPWMFHAREYLFALYIAGQEAEKLPAMVGAANAPAAPVKPGAPDGSNAWAIGPSRTASGKAMLYINPHIPIDEPYEWHVTSDQGLNMYGGAAYGAGILPFLGFNDHLGWSLTVNYPDIADVYSIEHFDLKDPYAYKFGQEVRHITKWTVPLKVRKGNKVESQDITLYKTHYGPILHEEKNTSYVVRVAAIEHLRGVEQWYRMAKASNMAQWKEAVSLKSLVFHNLVYADDQGNIGYIYNCASPRRNPRTDPAGILDGSDPANDWKGYYEIDGLPQVWNPKAGYVQNCNSPPFQTIGTAGPDQNPKAADFPRGMVGKDLVDGRIAMSHDLLGHAQKWGLDDLERAAFETKVYSLETSRGPLLLDAAKPESAALSKRIGPAIEMVKNWDGRLALDSVPSTLYSVWVEKLFSPQWAKRRQPGDLTKAFDETLSDLEKSFGKWEVSWGDINRHQRFDTNAGLAVSDSRESLPIAGGHGSLGVSFCYLARNQAGSKMRYGYHGHSFVCAVEFGDAPKARSIVPFGNSRDPASAHYNDQAKIYAAGKFKGVVLGDGLKEFKSYHPGE